MVRLKVKLKVLKGARAGSEIETVAIANTGYGSDQLEVALPEMLARELGFLPELPQSTRVEKYLSATGFAEVHYIPEALEILVESAGRSEGPILVSACISATDEVLINDRLIEEFGIILERPGSGLWRFSDEPPLNLRESEEPERW
jgi:hypothetical protein